MFDGEYKREGEGNFGECRRGFEASSSETTKLRFPQNYRQTAERQRRVRLVPLVHSRSPLAPKLALLISRI